MKRTLKFEDRAFAELTQWIQQDRKMALKITELVEAIKRDPFSGIGKPELLKHHRKGLLVSAHYSGTPTGVPRH